MKLLNRFLIAIFATLLAGCVNSNTIDGDIIPVLTDVVTFDGNIDGCARFSFNMIDDSPTINLVGNKELNDENLAPGRRILLSYQYDNGKEAYQSGNITIRAVSLINNGNVGVLPLDELEGWNDDSVYLYSIWRSGCYINIHCRLIYSTEPRRFALVASESSLDADIINLYLVHDLPTPVNSFDRTYFASFNIADVWNRPRCKGIRIHIANSNLSKYTFDFMK